MSGTLRTVQENSATGTMRAPPEMSTSTRRGPTRRRRAPKAAAKAPAAAAPSKLAQEILGIDTSTPKRAPPPRKAPKSELDELSFEELDIYNKLLQMQQGIEVPDMQKPEYFLYRSELNPVQVPGKGFVSLGGYLKPIDQTQELPLSGQKVDIAYSQYDDNPNLAEVKYTVTSNPNSAAREDVKMLVVEVRDDPEQYDDRYYISQTDAFSRQKTATLRRVTALYPDATGVAPMNYTIVPASYENRQVTVKGVSNGYAKVELRLQSERVPIVMIVRVMNNTVYDSVGKFVEEKLSKFVPTTEDDISDETLEVECSLGMFIKNFIPGIPTVDSFNNIVNNLTLNVGEPHTSESSVFILNSDRDHKANASLANLRLVTENGKTHLERKIRSSKRAEDREWKIRVTSSKEGTVAEGSDIFEDFKRRMDIEYNRRNSEEGFGGYTSRLRSRKRWTVDVGFVDCTVVKQMTKLADGKSTSKVSYEVEIEFNNDALKNPVEDSYKFCYLIERIIAMRFSLAVDDDNDIVIPDCNFPPIIKTFDSIKSAYNHIMSVLSNTKNTPLEIFKSSPSKPINYKRDNLFKAEYAATAKLDGVRSSILMVNGGIYIISPKYSIYKISGIGDPNILAYADCEMAVVDEEISVHLFDCPFYQRGDSLECGPENDLETRLLYTEGMVGIMEEVRCEAISVYAKKYFYGHDMVDKVEAGKREMKENNYKFDGIIFQPVGEYYTKGLPPRKWKPPALLTIDFLLKRDRDERYFPYVASREGIVKFTDDASVSATDYYGDYDGKIVECRYNKDRGHFEPIRIRYDKSEPNFITIAKDVWNDIRNPITLAQLKQDVLNSSKKRPQAPPRRASPKRPPMRQGPPSRSPPQAPPRAPSQVSRTRVSHGKEEESEQHTAPPTAPSAASKMERLRTEHNRIKRSILTKIKRESSSNCLIDIGSGRGGDLGKWTDSRIGFDTVHAIEPNNENLSELTRRMGNMNMKNTKVITVNEQLRNVDIDALPENCNITALFSMTHFTQADKEKLAKLFKRMAPGNMFAGIVLRQLEVRKLLKKDGDSVDNDYFTITRRDKGKKWTVDTEFKDSTSMVKYTGEAPLNTKAFIKAAAKAGMELVEEYMLDEDHTTGLSDEEMIFSKLNYAFILKKE